jgi:hypothetical protein
MPVKMTKDGRTIRTGVHYTIFRAQMYDKLGGSCQKCERSTSLHVPPEYDGSFHCHHRNGRGLGGGKRDDTHEACEGLCGKCHRAEHNRRNRSLANSA